MAFSDHLSRADRLAQAALGGPVRYVTEVGDAVDVTGIFDAAYVRTNLSDATVIGSGPAVFVLLSDLRTALGDPSYDPENDEPTIIVNGTQYRAREVRQDGTGTVVFILSETDF